MGIFVISESNEGFRFLLKTQGGEILGLCPYVETKEEVDQIVRHVDRLASKAPIEDKTGRYHVKHEDPKFIVFEDENQMFRYNLLAEDGSCILSSTGYTSFEKCVETIAKVRRTIAGASRD